MSLIAKQLYSEVGETLTLNAASNGGDTITNTGKGTLLFQNSTGAAITVTIPKVVSTIRQTAYGTTTVSDKVITVPANGMAVAYVPPAATHADPDTNITDLTYSTEVGLTVAYIDYDFTNG